MNSRPTLVAILVLLCSALSIAAAVPSAVLGEGAGSDYFIAAVTLDDQKQPTTSIRQRTDATSGKWIEIARLQENVTAIAAVGSRFAVASGDGWRMIWDDGGVMGNPLPNNRTISALAGDGDALWALAGPEIFRWTSAGGWQQRGTLPAEAIASGASIAIRDGVPWIAYVTGGAIHVDHAQASGWAAVTQLPAAPHFKLLSGAPMPLLASADESGNWTVYDLGLPSPTPQQTIALGKPGDVVIAGTTLRALLLSSDGVHQLAFDNFGRGARSGPDLIAQVAPPLNATADWPNYIVMGMAMAAVLIALRTRSTPSPETLTKAHVRIAPIARRVAAGTIDAAPYLIAMAYVLEQARDNGPVPSDEMGLRLYLPIFAGLAIYVLHVMVSELLFSRSLGKFIFGLRVVTIDGEKAPAGRIVLRNLMRVLDVALGLPFMIIILSPSGQRFGDMAARTLVIADDATDGTKDESEQEKV